MILDGSPGQPFEVALADQFGAGDDLPGIAADKDGVSLMISMKDAVLLADFEPITAQSSALEIAAYSGPSMRSDSGAGGWFAAPEI